MPLKSSSTKSNCAWRRETCAFAKSESNGVLGRTAGGTTGLLGVTTGVLGVTAGLLGVTTGLLGVTGATGGVGVTTFLELANTQLFPSLVRKYW